MSDAPAGWYDDGTGQSRYWDGTAWTDRYADDAVPTEAVEETVVAAVEFVAAEPEPAEKKQGRLAAFAKKAYEEGKKAIDDAQAADKAWKANVAEKYGNILKKGTFGGQTVEIFDSGYVRVGLVLGKKDAFEKLMSISHTMSNKDKSAGGRALAGVATMGVSTLFSNEKITQFLTIATDKKVHSLRQTGGSSLHAAALELEAAGNGILDARRATAAAQPATVVVEQAAAQLDVADQLVKLAGLREQGILTGEEFAAQKAKLLGL